jgi:hypothetical protein
LPGSAHGIGIGRPGIGRAGSVQTRLQNGLRNKRDAAGIALCVPGVTQSLSAL